MILIKSENPAKYAIVALGVFLFVTAVLLALLPTDVALLCFVLLGAGAAAWGRALWIGRGLGGILVLRRVVGLGFWLLLAAHAEQLMELVLFPRREDTWNLITALAKWGLSFVTIQWSLTGFYFRLAQFHRHACVPRRAVERLFRRALKERRLALPGHDVTVVWQPGFRQVGVEADGHFLESPIRPKDVGSSVMPAFVWQGRLADGRDLLLGPASGGCFPWRLPVVLGSRRILKDRCAQRVAYTCEWLRTVALLTATTWPWLAAFLGLGSAPVWVVANSWYPVLAGGLAALLLGAAGSVAAGGTHPTVTRVGVWTSAAVWAALGARLVWSGSAWLFQPETWSGPETVSLIGWIGTLALLAASLIGLVVGRILFFERLRDLPVTDAAEWSVTP